MPLVIGTGAAEVRVEGRDAEPVRIECGGRLVLRSAIGEPLKVGIERTARDEARATATEVTAIQEFHDLFAAEALAPGVELSIGSLAILFSDLKDSTAMYERIGDAQAYALARKHFEFMTEGIRGPSSRRSATR